MTLYTVFLSNNATRASILALGCGLLMLVLVGGCSGEPESDTSLLTGDPCAAPCWHNIIPGTSSKDDVQSQLKNSPLVRKGSLKYSLTEWEGASLGVFSWEGRSKEQNKIYLQEGKVLWIEINLDHSLTLGEIIDKYGSPDAIYAPLFTTGALRYHIAVYYPAQGLLLSSASHPYDPSGDKSVVISEDLAMMTVVYFAPTSLEGVFSDVFLLSPDMVEYRMANAQEWQGFGRIELTEIGR